MKQSSRAALLYGEQDQALEMYPPDAVVIAEGAQAQGGGGATVEIWRGKDSNDVDDLIDTTATLDPVDCQAVPGYVDSDGIPVASDSPRALWVDDSSDLTIGRRYLLDGRGLTGLRREVITIADILSDHDVVTEDDMSVGMPPEAPVSFLNGFEWGVLQQGHTEHGVYFSVSVGNSYQIDHHSGTTTWVVQTQTGGDILTADRPIYVESLWYKLVTSGVAVTCKAYNGTTLLATFALAHGTGAWTELDIDTDDVTSIEFTSAANAGVTLYVDDLTWSTKYVSLYGLRNLVVLDLSSPTTAALLPLNLGESSYRVKWTYRTPGGDGEAGTIRMLWTYFDVVRQAAAYSLTWRDLRSVMPWIADEEWSEQRGLRFEPQIAAAWDRFMFDLTTGKYDVNSLRGGPVVAHVHLQACRMILAELGVGMPPGRDKEKWIEERQDGYEAALKAGFFGDQPAEQVGTSSDGSIDPDPPSPYDLIR